MRRALNYAGRAVRITGWALLICFILVVANAVLRPKLPVKLVLPNGSIITRPFYIYPFWPRTSLYSKDGETILASNIEFICFNDSYVQVISLIHGGGGIFDSDSELDLKDTDYFDMLRASGLKIDGKTCNGYYTGMLGPELLFYGNEWPFLPSCDWRNFENLSLQDRSWFERPCKGPNPPKRD